MDVITVVINSISVVDEVGGVPNCMKKYQKWPILENIWTKNNTQD